jgi:MoxR-like ATPase
MARDHAERAPRPVGPSTHGEAAPLIRRLRSAVGGAILGKDEVIDRVLIGVLAGGHVLLEDVPGVGKTTLARAIAAALGCSFRRIQFTSDLLPGDILGVTVFDRNRTEFRFKEGPIFANLVLADEVNRTTPKTQSALLEAMNTGQVHIDGVRHQLPEPFHVIATQNPREYHGTFPLPESQLDRFLIRTSVGYPGRDAERRVMHGSGEGGEDVAAVVEPEQLLALQALARRVRMDGGIEDYILQLVDATRSSAELALGASPRGTQALTRASRARALLEGRDFTIPDDVKAMSIPVLAHRVLPAGDPMSGARPTAEIIAELVDAEPPPA